MLKKKRSAVLNTECEAGGLMAGLELLQEICVGEADGIGSLF